MLFATVTVIHDDFRFVGSGAETAAVSSIGDFREWTLLTPSVNAQCERWREGLTNASFPSPLLPPLVFFGWSSSSLGSLLSLTIFLTQPGRSPVSGLLLPWSCFFLGGLGGAHIRKW